MNSSSILPDITVGQKVWVEGRKHPTKQDWMEAYGHITNIIYDDEDEENVEQVVVTFDETGTFEIYKGYRFENWNDKNDSWSLFKED